MTPSVPPKLSAGASSDFGRYAGLGLQFVATVALFGGLGWWIDARAGTTPWLLVAGVLAGAVVAFVLILRSVPPAQSKAPLHPYDDSNDDSDDKHAS